MDFSLHAAFWIMLFSLVMTSGAGWAYVISSGMLLEYVAIMVIAAAEVGALVASVPVILNVLIYAKAAYLLRLGRASCAILRFLV